MIAHGKPVFTVFIIVVFLAAVVSATEWEPVLPCDPNVTLNDICILSDGIHGWAAGSTSAGGETFSAVFRTIDGSSWTYVPFADSTGTSLSSVCFVTEDAGWILGSSGRIYKTIDGGDTWIVQSVPTARAMNEVFFIDELEGWIAGGENDGNTFAVLKTTDGGGTWQDLSFGSECYRNDALFFADEMNGWIGGLDRSLEPHIHRTTDGGSTWSRQTVPPGVGNAGGVNAIDFPVDDQIGWASTSSIYDVPYGGILHTTDGGANWVIQDYTGMTYNYDLDAQDAERVAIVSKSWFSDGVQVVVTDDGGDSWISHPTYLNVYTYGITYIDSDIWIAGMGSGILKSTDAGESWEWGFNAPTWNSMGWRDSVDGYLVAGSSWGEDQYCVRTTDGGSTWFYDPQTPGGKQVQFVDPDHGWVLKEGDISGVFRTTDGGSNWTYSSIGSGSWIGGFTFATPDSGWAFGSGGTIRFTSDGGTSWSSQTSNTTAYVSTVYFIDSREGWAAGGYGGGSGFIRHTTNGGDTWNSQTPAYGHHFLASCFVDTSLGLLGALNGPVHRTTDGGDTWQIVQTLPHYYISDIYMEDLQNGWITAYNYWGNNPGEDGRGFIYRTTDGGLSWNQQWSSPRIKTFIQDLASQSCTLSWACGNHNHALRFSRPPDVTIALNCLTPTVHRGDRLRYEVTVTNETSQTQIFKGWARLRLPGGRWYNQYAIPPVTIRLAPYQSATRTIAQTVLEKAPYGRYSYWGFTGSDTAHVWDQDMFEFDVIPSAQHR
jgi:photosystem II stability/assembly factor-like uncharacterized protein